jgi:hypothetical protein
VACDDGSILDSATWNWGYQPEGSKNYTHIIGAVFGNITVKVEGSSPASTAPTKN